jgi:hypothetical protein
MENSINVLAKERENGDFRRIQLVQEIEFLPQQKVFKFISAVEFLDQGSEYQIIREVLIPSYKHFCNQIVMAVLWDVGKVKSCK